MRKTTLVVILPVSINILAAPAGSTGKTENLGMIGVVLMDKRASEGTTYAMIDKKKYAKEFDKTVALGNSYQAVMTGDLTCGSTEAEKFSDFSATVIRSRICFIQAD
jgi:hypothetical protein